MAKIQSPLFWRCLFKVVVCSVLAGLPLMLAGCGQGSSAVESGVQALVLNGNVHGGQQPVAQSNIALFATSASGYNTASAPSALTPLATTQTDNYGNFRINGTIVCPADATSQAYVVSAGGNPGLTAGTDNAAIFLVAALGPCSGLASMPNVVINEVTTVAAAYALSGFAPVGGKGMTETAVVSGKSMPGIATSTTNTQGLTDAFANAANIVNVVAGQANAATPAGNGTVPVATIDALADILQVCVNTASATSDTACGTLLTAATPPAATGIAKPANVFQAALDIAQYPGNNVATLFGLIVPQPPFATSLTSAPNDWTLGVTYTSGLMASPLGMGIDGGDNIYVSGSTGADLIKFNAQGAGGTANLLPTLSTTTDNLRELVADPSGNIWLSDGGSTYDGPIEYTASGSLVTTASYGSSNANNYAVASDKYGDIWSLSYKKSTCSTSTTGGSACTLFELVNSQTTPATYKDNYMFGAGLFVVRTPDVGGARGLAVDSNTGNVWFTDVVSGVLTLFPTTLAKGAAANATAAATPIALGSPASGDVTNNYGSVAVAVDANGSAWTLVQGGPAVASGTTTAAVPGALYGVGSTGTILSTANGLTDNGGLITPSFLAIDGNNNIFISNTGASMATSAVVEYDPSTASGGTTPVGFLSPNLGFSPGANFASGALTGGTVYQAGSIAVDRSGAIWVLSTGTGTSPSLANLVQILGVAAPTDPVQADGKFGVKP